MQSQTLSEKEILGDMLDQEKSLIKLYATAITESTCPNMRQVLLNNMTQVCTDQYNVFDQMRTKGYYETKEAPQNTVQQAKDKYAQVATQLNS